MTRLHCSVCLIRTARYTISKTTAGRRYFAELYPQFTEKGAVVLGVSKDSVASHKKFEEKYGLPFTLLSDEGLEVLQAYDVWKEKSMYGRKYFGVVRSTYLIDENGIIVRALEKVNAAENPQQMLNEL